VIWFQSTPASTAEGTTSTACAPPHRRRFNPPPPRRQGELHGFDGPAERHPVSTRPPLRRRGECARDLAGREGAVVSSRPPHRRRGERSGTSPTPTPSGFNPPSASTAGGNSNPSSAIFGSVFQPAPRLHGGGKRVMRAHTPLWCRQFQSAPASTAEGTRSTRPSRRSRSLNPPPPRRRREAPGSPVRRRATRFNPPSTSSVEGMGRTIWLKWNWSFQPTLHLVGGGDPRASRSSSRCICFQPALRLDGGGNVPERRGLGALASPVSTRPPPRQRGGTSSRSASSSVMLFQPAPTSTAGGTGGRPAMTDEGDLVSTRPPPRRRRGGQ